MYETRTPHFPRSLNDLRPPRGKFIHRRIQQDPSASGTFPRRVERIAAHRHASFNYWRKITAKKLTGARLTFFGATNAVLPDDEGSNHHQANELLLSKVPLPENNIHRVEGELDPASASKKYAETLKAFAEPNFDFPRFDLIYLGMGEDGHTASLFPHSPVQVNEPVIAVTANYQDRPANRVTLTQLVFNQARMVVFMATGEKKAETLAHVLSERYNPELYPAQRIDPKDGQLIWLVDESAVSKLPRKIRGLKICEG
ncbi:MAG: 6-phosphogluconolactonase [Anaerolineales bacterium]